MSGELSTVVDIRLSPAFEAAIADAEPVRYPGIGADDPGFLLRQGTPLSVEFAAEAQSLLDRLSLEPADFRIVALFLGKIADAIGNAPDESAFEARVSAVVWLCEDLPAWVFSDTAAREIARSATFFPSGAEVRRQVMAAAEPILQRVALLKSLVKRASEPPRAASRPGLRSIGAALREINSP